MTKLKGNIDIFWNGMMHSWQKFGLFSLNELNSFKNRRCSKRFKIRCWKLKHILNMFTFVEDPILFCIPPLGTLQPILPNSALTTQYCRIWVFLHKKPLQCCRIVSLHLIERNRMLHTNFTQEDSKSRAFYIYFHLINVGDNWNSKTYYFKVHKYDLIT